MIKKMICIAVCTWMCACCEKNDGGGYYNNPENQPLKNPRKPPTPKNL